MLIETFTFDSARSLAPLIEALGVHGGVVLVGSAASQPGTRTVSVRFPHDEYREKKCRLVIAEWRGERTVN